MGGEYKAVMVYGFDYEKSCVMLRGSNKFYIGSKGSCRTPIYFCIYLKSTTLGDIQKEIDNLSESQKNIISEFDKFANYYNVKPSWILACIGELEVDILNEPSKKYLLDCFQEWTSEIKKLYNEDGTFTKASDECIVGIFTEESMDFMIDKARKLKTFEEIYEMIEDYYKK